MLQLATVTRCSYYHVVVLRAQYVTTVQFQSMQHAIGMRCGFQYLSDQHCTRRLIRVCFKGVDLSLFNGFQEQWATSSFSRYAAMGLQSTRCSTYCRRR